MRPVITNKDDEMKITRGTGNVFADLGYADADERQTKLRLAHMINGVITRQKLTQTALLKNWASTNQKFRHWRIINWKVFLSKG